jgi:peptidoglycan lytic transglycosylase
MRSFRSMILIVALAVAAPLAPSQASDGTEMAAAMEAAAKRDWGVALGHARRISSPAAETMVDWHRLRAGDGRWEEYTRFIDRHSDWPGMELLRRKGEDIMPPALPPNDVIAYFAVQKPQTPHGLYRYASALLQAGRKQEAETLLVNAWTRDRLSADGQKLLLSHFQPILAPHHSERLENLLWEGDAKEAEAMLPLVNRADIPLAKARIALMTNADGVDGLISAVPAAKQNDPGLAWERLDWRARKGRWQDSIDLLFDQSFPANKLGRPEVWAKRRQGLVREAIEMGKFKTAYTLASNHYLGTGPDFAELEWQAGYVALTRHNDPLKALPHFQRFKDAVDSPISLGRAGYWLGRTYEALGNPTAAINAYAEAAKHQTSFYGQLAAERGGLQPDRSLAGSAAVADWRSQPFAQSEPIQAALLLNQAGDYPQMQRFILHVQESLNPAQSASLAQMALDLGHPFVAVRIGKRLAGEGIVVPQAYYPVTDLAQHAGPIPPELALAIARQESELFSGAISPAGARGLMQLMPGTAEHVAKELGIDYSLSKLTADPNYNARLGTAYLAELLEEFNGSYILAVAAYNAGPHRARRWIQAYGDPRSGAVDPIVWIESIPYNETRNYVMRVLESLHVYRTRLNGGPVPLQLNTDIRRS